MSEKAAAAQKWAEAKEALDSALLALDVAKATYSHAEDQEREAWAALEALAGRTLPQGGPAPAPAPNGGEVRTSGFMRVTDYSLPIRPLG